MDQRYVQSALVKRNLLAWPPRGAAPEGGAAADNEDEDAADEGVAGRADDEEEEDEEEEAEDTEGNTADDEDDEGPEEEKDEERDATADDKEEGGGTGPGPARPTPDGALADATTFARTARRAMERRSACSDMSRRLSDRSTILSMWSGRREAALPAPGSPP